jgi:hypothetical protein
MHCKEFDGPDYESIARTIIVCIIAFVLIGMMSALIGYVAGQSPMISALIGNVVVISAYWTNKLVTGKKPPRAQPR